MTTYRPRWPTECRSFCSIFPSSFFQWVKPQTIDFDPRYKKKGKSKTGKIEKRKQGVKFEHKRDQVKEMAQKAQATAREQKTEKLKPYNVFDRFKKSAST